MSTVAQVTKNCHFVSRFLTKPWEGERRELSYVDFATGRIARKSSRVLFAADKINSQAVENWLNVMVEQPLDAIRPRLAGADPKALDDWRFYRAAVLMLWLQGARVEAISDHDARRHLDTLAAMAVAEVDQLVTLIHNEYALALVFTVIEDKRLAPLMVPSTGTFRFIYEDPNCLSGQGIGTGLPLQQECALVATPRARAAPVDLSPIVDRIANASVGMLDAVHVVISPDVVAAAASEAELVDRLRELRRLSETLVAKVHEKRSVIAGMYESQGLRVVRDATGRLARSSAGADS